MAFSQQVISVNGWPVAQTWTAGCASCFELRQQVDVMRHEMRGMARQIHMLKEDKRILATDVKGLEYSLRTALKNTYTPPRFKITEQEWYQKVDEAPINALRDVIAGDREKREKRRQIEEQKKKEEERKKAAVAAAQSMEQQLNAGKYVRVDGLLRTKGSLRDNAPDRKRPAIAIKKENKEQKVIEQQRKMYEQAAAGSQRLKASRDAVKAKAGEMEKPTVTIKQEDKTPKRKATALVPCQNCGKDFDEEKNKKGACTAHSGYKEVDNDSDRWCDWDEECHGYCESFINDPEYADGFIWTCCGEAGDERKCSGSKHEVGGKRKRSRT